LNDYHYRKHIKIHRNLNVVILGIFIIMFCFLAILIGEQSGVFIIIAIVFTFVAAMEWYFMSRFNKIRVSIDDEKIIYKNYKGEKILKFEDIDCIQFLTIKYSGGWIKIKSNEKTIRFTTVMKDIHKLSLEIKEQLDIRGLNHVYKDNRYKNFIKTSAYVDDSWERVYRIWWKLTLITIATAIISVLIGIFLQFGDEKTAILTMMAFLFPTVVYIITEIVFALRVGRLFKKDIVLILTRDTLYERSVYKKSMIMSLLIYVLTVVILFYM